MGTRVVPVPALTGNMSSNTSNTTTEAMDVTSPHPTSGGAGADSEPNGKNSKSRPPSPTEQPANSSLSSNMPAPPPAASSGVHQPKVVQAAFIHKLYNMLEDNGIQHLISWSSNGESFVMSPTADFSKVLSQYFKHTNISSFVRQLNMYGFHKERDVFHTGSPETTLWEFKHGTGNFKRGDIAGLREIRRRTSKHVPMTRETNYPKPGSSLPGTPAEPVQIPPESTEARMLNLEHMVYDMGARLQRSEENSHYMHVKNQAAMETMGRLLHFNQELSRALVGIVSPDSPTHREVISLQGEMQRQAETIRAIEDPPEPGYSGRQPYFGTVDNAPVSPRQLAQDDARRPGGLTVPQPRGQPLYRPAIPSGLSGQSSRRQYGSIGGNTTTQSSPLRNAAAAPPPAPHPLSNVESSSSNLGRRHTAADIRAHGWQPGPSPFSAANAPPSQWPPSPGRVPAEDQRIRESLSSYSLQAASQSRSQSRPATPPHSSNGGAGDTFGSWSWGAAGGRDIKGSLFKDASAPQTRRGSMAHILNPSDSAERGDEGDDLRGEDDRKRKRMQ